VTKAARSCFNSVIIAKKLGEFGVGLFGAVDGSPVVSISFGEEVLDEVVGRVAIAVVNCSTTVVMRAFRSLNFLLDRQEFVSIVGDGCCRCWRRFWFGHGSGLYSRR